MVLLESGEKQITVTIIVLLNALNDKHQQTCQQEAQTYLFYRLLSMAVLLLLIYIQFDVQ